MKNVLLSMLFLLFALTSSAQVGEKGKIYVDLNGGLGIYKTHTISTVMVGSNGITSEVKDTAGATYFAIGAEYGIANWVSAGLNLKSGSYLYENNEQKQYKSNNVNTIEASSHFYFLNKDKFTFFGSLALGYTFFGNYYDDNFFSSEEKYNGFHSGVGLGLKWLLIKERVGLFFNYEYNTFNFDLKERTINGNQQDLSNLEYNLNVRGSELRLGLSVKI